MTGCNFNQATWGSVAPSFVSVNYLFASIASENVLSFFGDTVSAVFPYGSMSFF
jgi:hypothetical protein